MNIIEGYNRATSQYTKELADKMIQAGIPSNFCEAACKFYAEGVPLEQLQDDFKKWNRYVVKNSCIPDGKEKDLRRFNNYMEFVKTIQSAIQPFICPNPIYNDGVLSIGECKTQRDARWFPIQNLAYPDDNTDFCICKKKGGYLQFQKYINDGRRLFIIYDKQRSANDPYKRVLMMSKNGVLYFWNHFDQPCGTTKKKNDPIWQYIESLPNKAQIALSDVAEGLKESLCDKQKSTNKAMIAEIQPPKLIPKRATKILSSQKVYKTWKIKGYEVMNGSNLVNTAPSLKAFGEYRDLRLYYSKKHTYMLMYRCKSQKYFFAEIVDAPELGRKKTKYKPIKLKEIPQSIISDALPLIRSHQKLRNLLF